MMSVRFIVGLALVIGVASVGFLAYHSYNKPDKVANRLFWGAVDGNLQTSSFSRVSSTKNGGQSAEQRAAVFISPKQGVHTKTVYTQTGLDEAEAVTENIGTAFSDYVRYVSIETSQRSSSGKQFDFSSIVGVWAGAAEDKSETNGQLFGQSVLTAIPFGDLTAQQRAKLIAMMKESGVYEYTMASPERSGILRRPSYSFAVTLKPAEYITVLKQFAADMGLTQLKDVNPADYKNAPKSSFQITVDGWSKQITSVVEPGSSQHQEISARGARLTLPDVPSNRISIEELQSRLQAVE